MIRRSLLLAGTILFLLWLFWPRAWLPAGWAERERAWRLMLPGLGGPTSLLPPAGGDGAGAVRLPAAQDRSRDQVAILALGPAEETLAAEAALRSAGVPYCVLSDEAAALAHRVVLVPAGDRPLPRRRADLDALERFVSAGGTLIVATPALPPWPELSGVGAIAPARARVGIALRPGADEGFAGLSRPEELEVPLAAPGGEGPWTGGLVLRRGQAEALAWFDGGREVALSRRRLGAGRVYVLGAALSDLVVRPRAGRQFGGARAPDNAFEPAGDVWPLVLRAWYEAFTPDWALMRSLPGGASGYLLLSHAIESGGSVSAARAWAVWESGRGVRSTWFVQTNDCDGGQPGPFYDAGLASVLRELAARGHELAAHTVVGDPLFADAPLGDGLASRRSYRPQTEAGRVWDETRLGEVRVPKKILESDVPGLRVAGFRSPAGAFPDDLDAELESSGYLYDSSRSAAAVMSHRPFLLTRGRALAAESRVVELAATFDDEAAPRDARPDADAILRAARAIFAEEGVVVWQSDPTDAGLARLAAVLDGLPPGTRVGPLGEAARWWYARVRARFWTEASPDGLGRVLRLELPPDADGAELSFETAGPAGLCRPLTPGLAADCSGRTIVLRATGGARAAALAYGLPTPPPPRPVSARGRRARRDRNRARSTRRAP